MDISDLITVRQAATLLGVSVQRVHQLVELYHLKRQTVNSRMTLLVRKEVEKLAKTPRPSGVPKK